MRYFTVLCVSVEFNMARVWDTFTMVPVFIWILYISTSEILAREVVLLDSTKFTRLTNWTTHKGGDDDSNHGWREGSYLTENGSPIRVFASCSVSSSGVDNWLRTPYIPRQGANSLWIEIRFSMRKCSGHSDPSSIRQCKETYNLYYYLADSDIANAEMPSWDSVTYKFVDKIAADNLYDDTMDIQMNTEKREIPLDRNLNGVYFAFQDLGACVTIISVKVYYILCPNVTHNYAFFMETPTSGSEMAYEEQTGTCVANAQQKNTPTYLCLNSGTWRYPNGGCQCLPGYEGRDGQACVECKPGFYKGFGNNESCAACPAHSFTTSPKSIECTCDDGYYKSKNDPPSAACTQPPSAPQQLQVESLTHNTITLRWLSPLYTGGRIDVRYRVECQKCGSTATYNPSWKDLNATKVIISGLRSSTTYVIKILAENGVTEASKKPAQYTQGTYTTKSSTQTVVNTRISNVGQNYVSMTWETAQDMPYTITKYQVKWYPRFTTGQDETNITTHSNYTFSNLVVDMEYGFQVRGYMEIKGWGEFTEPLYVRTGSQYGEHGYVTTVKSEMDQPVPSVAIIVGAVLAVILCMAIATAMIVLLLKKNRREYCGSETKGGDYDSQPYNPVVHCPPLEPHLNGGLTMPLFPPTERQKKTYVDPHTYEDPNQAVREFTREIDASHITIESVIGGGEFGDVCKGKLRIPCKPEMSVAIKTLKPGATDKNRLDFLTEASIMGQFDDPNVIFLEGVVTKSHPIMIVTEYMENGSLDSFLRNNDGKFTVIQLVGMMRGISSGMRYLSNMGYVHRDLAARNILTNVNLVCKVADFGLSREIDIDTSGGAYTTKGGKIPVRWTAPEAIAFRKFTSASDVWSYGVVMWEVISYGERPYWNWSNQDVIRAVDKGYRLPPPMDCPEAIHQLMLDCWQKERGNRPKFDTIVRSLDKFIRAPELLRKIAKPRPEQLLDTASCKPVQEVSHFSNVEGWLISIKMEKYIDNFLNAGYRTMEQVMAITPRELESRLGVTLIGHQKKILGSLQVLRAQRYGPSQYPVQMSDGFLV